MLSQLELPCGRLKLTLLLQHLLLLLLTLDHQLPLVEFLLDGVAGKRDMVLEDGVHPTAAAQERILDNVWEVLQPMLGKPVNRASSR